MTSTSTMAIPSLPYAGLKARIEDKIIKAEQYDLSQINELWLLILAQQPSLGALAATYIFASLIDPKQLDQLFHDKLLASRFSRVYLHLNADHAIWGWDKTKAWHVVRRGETSDLSGREALNMIRRTQPL